MKQIKPTPSRFNRVTAAVLIALMGSWSSGPQTQLPQPGELQPVRFLSETKPRGEYILGPGDAVVIELIDVPEYSGIFTIGPDGTFTCHGCAPFTLKG